jgi:F-type H+-transporting ATPase subunit alpha
LAPVPVQAQIAIVLALTEGLFDAVPMERIADAERAVADAAARIPAALGGRLLTAGHLVDADRAAIVALARTALAPFVAHP